MTALDHATEPRVRPAQCRRQQRADRRRGEGDRGDDAEHRRAPLRGAGELRDVQRAEQLERGQDDADEERHDQQQAQQPVGEHEPDGRRDHQRHLADAGCGSPRAPDAVGSPDRDHQQQHGDDVDGAEGRGDHERDGEGRGAAAVDEQRERTAEDRAHAQPDGVGRRRAGQPRGDVGVRLGPVDGVDVPGLERSGVQRPGHALERPGDEEQQHAVGHGHGEQPGHGEQAGEHQDRPVADGVGQAAGGQLEQQGDRAVHGDGHADVGRREPARGGQQDRDRDGDADGQPPERGEADEAPARPVGVQDGGHSG